MAKRADPRVTIKDIFHYPGNTTYVVELEEQETQEFEIVRNNFNDQLRFAEQYNISKLASMLLLQAVKAHILSVRLD